MRRRRVGVTARSRQNVGNQATGTLQFVTEMAAPLELRTPAGTCGKGCKESADGSMATKARESTGRMQSEERSQGERDGEVRQGTARHARMRRCLILRQGAKPPETPAPLSLGIQVPERREFVKGSQAAQQRRALDKFPSRSEDT